MLGIVSMVIRSNLAKQLRCSSEIVMEACGVCSSMCPLSTGLPSATESGSCCVAFTKLHQTLQSVFGFTSFRPGQLESMLPALHGKDTFVQLATGAGKSLWMFMVPLTYSETVVRIIISPLNSLMDEQVLKVPLIMCPVFAYGHRRA